MNKILRCLLGLALMPAAALEISGAIRADLQITLQQKNNDGSVSDKVLSDKMKLSRVLLRLDGEFMPFWSYTAVLQKNEDNNMQLDLDVVSPLASQISTPLLPSTALKISPTIPVILSQAYVRYHELDAVTLFMGLIPAPEISCTELSSAPLIGIQPQDAQIGTTIRTSGNHPGLKISGKASKISYEFGVWKQTPYHNLNAVPDYYTRTILDERSQNTALYPLPGALSLSDAQQLITTTNQGPIVSDFHAGSIKWAYGGRVTFIADFPHEISYAAALGYSHAPLNVPLVATVFGAFDNLFLADGTTQDLDAPNYSMNAYDYLTQATFDFNWASTIVQAQLGYQYQKLHNNSSQHYYTSQDVNALDSETAASEAFNATPKSSACWAQWGAMLQGGRYKFDATKGVVSGVACHGHKPALEFVVRAGMVLRKNIMAFLYQAGFDDYSTADQLTPLQSAANPLDSVSLIVLDDTHRYLLLMINNTGASQQDTLENGVSIVAPNQSGVAFQSRMIGFSTGLNYYPSDNMVFKMTYRFEHYQFKKEVSDSWLGSLYSKNRQLLSLRCETVF